jgi:hypothetical protein
MHSPASANIYIYIYGSDFFTCLCLCTNKRANGQTDKRSVVKCLLHSHVLFILLLFFCASNVCSDHVVIDSTTKSRLGEWSRKHVHTHTHTMTTLLEMAVYDRLPAKSTYNTSTKKQKEVRKETRRGGKVVAIVHEQSQIYVCSMLLQFFNQSC